ncbi:hypothetical protein DFQ26_007893, partial [Actinomortierella ambigua]
MSSTARLSALPYAAEAFDSYRKRMCHTCLLYHTRSTFKHRCQDCDQVYYCSELCKTIGMDPTSGCHPKLCRALRRLATWDSDRHTKSIIKLYLQVLLSHWRERNAFLTPYQHHRQLLKDLEEEKLQRGQEDQQQQKQEQQPLLKEADSEDIKTVIVPEIGSTNEANSPPPPSQGQEAPRLSSLSDQLDTRLCISSASNPGSDATVDGPQRSPLQEPIENTFEDVRALQSHVEDWDEEEHQDWNKQAQVVLSLLEMAGLTEMRVVVDRAKSTSDDAKENMAEETEERRITAEDVKFTVSALESNCFGMFDRSRKKPVCFGRAIFPIASFFNHSCECNATAVQADGAEDVTGDDVLGVFAQEDAAKAAAAAKAVPVAAVTSVTGSNPLDTADQIQESGSTGGTTTPIAESEEETKSVEVVVEDPYESMVGEFRAMSFFAMQDIPE